MVSSRGLELDLDDGRSVWLLGLKASGFVLAVDGFCLRLGLGLDHV